jgi:hypothetical protein
MDPVHVLPRAEEADHPADADGQVQPPHTSSPAAERHAQQPTDAAAALKVEETVIRAAGRLRRIRHDYAESYPLGS